MSIKMKTYIGHVPCMCKHVHVLFVVYSGIAYVLVVFLKILRYQLCYLTLEL